MRIGVLVQVCVLHFLLVLVVMAQQLMGGDFLPVASPSFRLPCLCHIRIIGMPGRHCPQMQGRFQRTPLSTSAASTGALHQSSLSRSPDARDKIKHFYELKKMAKTAKSNKEPDSYLIPLPWMWMHHSALKEIHQCMFVIIKRRQTKNQSEEILTHPQCQQTKTR